ncbi:MAG TPA: hypothetical protein PKX93_12300, partial [bacterium]|nr:hypothetical protein [bacterium]
PDGSWLAYVKNSDIYARLTDLTTSPVKLTVSSDVPKADVTFSPDGRWILFTGTSGGRRQIYALPIRITESPRLLLPTGSPVNLTPLTADNYQGRFSPDGGTIAFISTRAQLPELWLMDTDGRRQRRVTFSVNPPVNPSCVQFSPYDSNLLAYLSGTPEKIWTADISRLPTSGSLRLPETVASQFSWGASPVNLVWAYRTSVFQTLDKSLKLKYRLWLFVDTVSPPASVVLTENLPAGWVLTEVKINGVTPWPMTSNNQTTGSLKWNFGPAGIAPLRNSLIELTVDLSAEAASGNWRYLTGWVELTSGLVVTSGDAAFKIAGPALSDYPCLPVDTDGNWQISDEELLQTIDLWVTAGQKHGWPEVTEWDY